MASAGTLLSDLTDSAGPGDGDLVQKILSDMNVSSPGAAPGGRPVPPPMPQQMSMDQARMAGTMAPMTMDNRIPTSHIIGNESPSNADFAAAMMGVTGQRASEHMLMGAPVMSAPAALLPGVASAAGAAEPPSKNLYGRIVEAVKVPFVIAFLFFIFSMPPVRVLLSHYAPSMIRPTGEFHITGLLFVSALVGLVFWVLNRVIAPLLSL